MSAVLTGKDRNKNLMVVGGIALSAFFIASILFYQYDPLSIGKRRGQKDKKRRNKKESTVNIGGKIISVTTLFGWNVTKYYLSFFFS